MTDDTTPRNAPPLCAGCTPETRPTRPAPEPDTLESLTDSLTAMADQIETARAVSRRDAAAATAPPVGRVVSSAPPGAPVCRACGCWELDACWSVERGPCHWVQPGLCSVCFAGSAKPGRGGS